jgi:hypothetical protein
MNAVSVLLDVLGGVLGGVVGTQRRRQGRPTRRCGSRRDAAAERGTSDTALLSAASQLERY